MLSLSLFNALTCGRRRFDFKSEQDYSRRGDDDGELWAVNSHDHLLATQQGVADELASAKRHGSVVVRHVCDILS